MKYRNYLILWGLIIFTSFTSSAQNIWKEFEHLFVPARTYVIYKTSSEITIDGKATETDWQSADWSECFKDIEGEKKPKPLYKTQVKMLWNESNLYILAELEEPHIWAYYQTNDMIVYHENDFEVFIDPDRDTHNYYEFEVNAQNTLFDLHLDVPYRNGGNANIEWNANGFKSAVDIDGTLNNPNDKDKKWTIEMAIPFSSLTTDENYMQPQNGDVWKINFSRVEWQTDIIEGNYVPKKNPATNKKLPEYNWVWSPQGIIDMHYPERWGMALFSTHKADGTKEKFQLPLEEKFAKYLWLIYYKQHKFSKENGKYATSLSELDVPENFNEGDTEIFLTLKTRENKYHVFLSTQKGFKLSIDQNGCFKTLSE